MSQISGQVYISAVPRSPDVDVFINVPPGAMEDIYGNRNANDTKVRYAVNGAKAFEITFPAGETVHRISLKIVAYGFCPGWSGFEGP